jgi:hypothetical protein
MDYAAAEVASSLELGFPKDIREQRVESDSASCFVFAEYAFGQRVVPRRGLTIRFSQSAMP